MLRRASFRDNCYYRDCHWIVYLHHKRKKVEHQCNAVTSVTTSNSLSLNTIISIFANTTLPISDQHHTTTPDQYQTTHIWPTSHYPCLTNTILHTPDQYQTTHIWPTSHYPYMRVSQGGVCVPVFPSTFSLCSLVPFKHFIMFPFKKKSKVFTVFRLRHLRLLFCLPAQPVTVVDSREVRYFILPPKDMVDRPQLMSRTDITLPQKDQKIIYYIDNTHIFYLQYVRSW